MQYTFFHKKMVQDVLLIMVLLAVRAHVAHSWVQQCQWKLSNPRWTWTSLVYKQWHRVCKAVRQLSFTNRPLIHQTGKSLQYQIPIETQNPFTENILSASLHNATLPVHPTKWGMCKCDSALTVSNNVHVYTIIKKQPQEWQNLYSSWILTSLDCWLLKQ